MTSNEWCKNNLSGKWKNVASCVSAIIYIDRYLLDSPIISQSIDTEYILGPQDIFCPVGDNYC